MSHKVVNPISVAIVIATMITSNTWAITIANGTFESPEGFNEQKTVWLSDLDLSKVVTGWAKARADRAAWGSPIKVGGRVFEKGVGVHANSAIHIDLKGTAERFIAYVGVDDGVKTRTGGSGTVEFQVIGDGKELWSSGRICSDEAKEIDIDLKGVQVLSLLVGDAGDGISNDHADWAEAKFVTAGKLPEVFSAKERPELENKLPKSVVAYPKSIPKEITEHFEKRIRPVVTKLPKLTNKLAKPVEVDWLVKQVDCKARIYRGSNSQEIVLDNGLIRRTFLLMPNAATVGFDNLMTGEAVLRGIKPEAKVRINGTEFMVGGLQGQVEYAYLKPEWIDSLRLSIIPGSFQFVGFETAQTKERFAWKRVRHSAELPWPPPGVSLKLNYRPPKDVCEGVVLSVHYEMYDGIPLISKWFTISNGSNETINLDSFVSEILATVDRSWMYVETDYAFGGSTAESSNHHAIHWPRDPQLTTTRDPIGASMLEINPPIGPDVRIKPGDSFESIRTFELILDSREPERRNLSVRRMYRTIAPWVTENPILMHVTKSDPAAVRLAIDQCAEVGFEMVVISFWSGFDHENTDPGYLAQWKKVADYARNKGIEIGGYSLLASRSAGPEHDCINPKTGKPGGAMYGHMPCLGSKWGIEYLNKLKTFMQTTGFQFFEHDGSYPGDVCASQKHVGHRGLNDSQWIQWKAITDFYKSRRANGVYLNVPDWYFLSGSSKVFFPYHEGNWSLPRERQVILARMNIYDGTRKMTPSMGWMFLPLVQYGGGGAAATIEPLHEHLDVYEWHLAQNFGSGVQACYRGPRLYDTEETKAVVKKWVDFYKKYRAILDSDIIHIRRPDGRHVDGLMHVNPQLKEKGLAVLFNPLNKTVKTSIELPLYYTGLTKVASIREQEGKAKRYTLDRQYNVRIPIDMKPNSITWFVIE